MAGVRYETSEPCCFLDAFRAPVGSSIHNLLALMRERSHPVSTAANEDGTVFSTMLRSAWSWGTTQYIAHSSAAHVLE